MLWLANTLIIILVLDILVSFFLIYVMTKKYLETKITAVQSLLVFFVVDNIVTITEVVILVLSPENLNMVYLDDTQFFPIIFSLSGIVGAGIFLFFIDYYESEQLPKRHVAVFFTILSAFVSFVILQDYNLDQGNNFSGPNLDDTPLSFPFLPAIMITYLIIVAFPKLRRLIKESDSEKKTHALQGLLIALIFFFILPSITITVANLYDFTIQTTIILTTLIPRTTVLIGSIVLAVTYGTTSPAYLHSQKLEKLLVITRSGTPIYSLDFIEKPTQRDDVLISGSLSAISGLLAESINVTEMESIEFAEKEILINHRSTIGFFLITDRPSQFVLNALNSAATELLKEFKIGNDTKAMTEMIVDQVIDRRIRTIFGTE